MQPGSGSAVRVLATRRAAMRFGGRGTSDNVESQRGRGLRRRRRARRRRRHADQPGRQPLRHRRRHRPADPVRGVRRPRQPHRRRPAGGVAEHAGPGRRVRPRTSARPTRSTRFSCQVLASTEEHWGRLFTGRAAQTYRAPKMVFYTRRRPLRLRRGGFGDGAVLLPGRPGASISTPPSSASSSSASPRPAISPRPMSSRTRSATMSRP